ncbi:hypothetical protein GE061_019048 [Apolygus lucorum]|uniref:Peptidase S1 domain-containing protein n=1 Tax=Apolygus lucorum TaxID=248454 RepID=A0A8S9X8Q6_APOLU|nr:hypothetical protein GE061_019048 [Apolygus lucorum]
MAKATSLFLLCASWALLFQAEADSVAEKDILEAVAEDIEGRGPGRCGGGSVLLRPADDPSSSVDWLFPNGWPLDFSLMSMIRPSNPSGTLVTLYDGLGVEHLQLRLVDGSIEFMYKPPSSTKLLLRFEAAIRPSQWSMFGLSVKGDAATLIVNCSEISQPLLRPRNTTLPTDGIILLGQPLLENSTGFHPSSISQISLSTWNATLPEADPVNVSFPELDTGNNSSGLSVIPLEIYFDLLKIAEFSNEAVRILDFPWIVSLQNQDGSHLCSANILTTLHLFTTCRCLTVATGSVITPIVPRRPEDIFVIAGVSKLNLPLRELMAKGQIRDVEKLHIHPRCTPLQKFDFAVVELDHFLYFSPFIRPIPKLSFDRMRSLPSFCSSAGWRETLPGWDRPENYLDDMVVTEFIILQNNECPLALEPKEGAHFICTSLFPQKTSSYSLNVAWPVATDDPITASRNPGDHGSGLLCDGRVVGILSHHSQDRMFSMFTSLGPAIPFFNPFFLDFINLTSNAPASHPALFLATALPLLVYLTLMSLAPA